MSRPVRNIVPPYNVRMPAEHMPAEQVHRTLDEKNTVHLKLVDRLRRQAAEVRRLTIGLTETQLATPTVSGKWSLKELVCHFRRIETVFGDRFNRLLTEDNPAIVPYQPEGDTEFAALTG